MLYDINGTVILFYNSFTKATFGSYCNNFITHLLIIQPPNRTVNKCLAMTIIENILNEVLVTHIIKSIP